MVMGSTGTGLRDGFDQGVSGVAKSFLDGGERLFSLVMRRSCVFSIASSTMKAQFSILLLFLFLCSICLVVLNEIHS